LILKEATRGGIPNRKQPKRGNVAARQGRARGCPLEATMSPGGREKAGIPSGDSLLATAPEQGVNNYPSKKRRRRGKGEECTRSKKSFTFNGQPVGRYHHDMKGKRSGNKGSGRRSDTRDWLGGKKTPLSSLRH